MTTINQLKKVLFDQKDKLADPHYDNIVFIVQDETSPVPGRTVPGSSDPVFPVRRLTLPQLIHYIDSQTGTDFPVPCLESRHVFLSDGYLNFVFSDLPSGLEYADIASCRTERQRRRSVDIGIQTQRYPDCLLGSVKFQIDF